MKITVYFNPKDVKPTVIQNATVVLVDVLRASSTIPVYLYHGAAGVQLFNDPGSAKKAFEKLKRGEGLLAGERDWEKIPGFHLGGSPVESHRDKVKGRIICLSSPTPLRVLKNAKYLVLGSFINLEDVYDSCLRGKRDVVIVCVGGTEDSAFAGMLTDFLQSTLGSSPIVMAESASQAVALYKPWMGRIADLLKQSEDGLALVKKGHAKDLDFCSKVSRVSSVPYLKDETFAKEDTPKRKILDEGKPKIPQKGKSIKITAPLFPKNPEHPVQGLDKSAKKPGTPSDPKKTDDKKHPVTAVAEEKKKDGPKSKKGEGKKPKGPPKPLFSKKTVAGVGVMVKKNP